MLEVLPWILSAGSLLMSALAVRNVRRARRAVAEMERIRNA